MDSRENTSDHTEPQKQIEMGLIDELNRLIGETVRHTGFNLYAATCESCLPSVASLEISESGAVELDLSFFAKFSSLNEFYHSFESDQTTSKRGNRIRELIEGIRKLNLSNDLNGKTKINFGRSHYQELIAFFQNINLGD